uniref:Uncharacterized protein n=1 Tax=Arundo donax TaxID=35708 RepID=A0A0A9HCI6_ARUDO
MENKLQCMSGLMKQWFAFLTKQFPKVVFLNKMQAALLDDGDASLMDKESDSENSLKNTIANENSPSNDVQHPLVHTNNRASEDHTSLPSEKLIAKEPHVNTNNRATEDHTSLPSQQLIAKDAHIQSSTNEDKDDAGTNLPCDTTRTNMRTRGVKAPSVNR